MSDRAAEDKFAARFLRRVDAARATEATAQQRWATGASATGAGIVDPIDGDYGFRAFGKRGPRDIPHRTRAQAQTDSIASYRANPMARAIIDTYVSFCVGDAGLTLTCTNDEVRAVAEQFWTDRRNHLAAGQELMLRDALILGEQLQEMMVGELSGICRRNPIDVTRVVDVDLRDGNPLWPESVSIRMPAGAEPIHVSVIDLDDVTGLREGEAFWWPWFKTLETDTRGAPFLMPVLDWLDSYDTVLANLIDRTALMRYFAIDVSIDGDQGDVDDWIDQRKSRQVPRSGSVEVHTANVKLEPITASTGAYEDVKTNAAVLTNIAGGTGLSKVWLAEPEDANRATSLTMAEPVRRRIGAVQNQWLAQMTDMVRFAVDRAVAAGRLSRYVTIAGAGGELLSVPASDTVTVTGPQIAAADAKVTAEVLRALAEAFAKLPTEVLSVEAKQIATQKAWEQFVGVPYRSELDNPDGATVDQLAEHIDAHGGDLPVTA
jgi:hypothetical protein